MLDWKRIDQLISLAFEEDIGAGDATTESVIPAEMRAHAKLIAKEKCVCAGLPLAEAVFRALDPGIEFKAIVKEGDLCHSGSVLAEIRGSARALLTAERTALNFIQRLSGIATSSRNYVEKLEKGSKCKILDTRKTTPGWRNIEKYAVSVGGASNHRIGLYDRIMIKDNHRELANLIGKDGIRRSVALARAKYPGLEIEVEVDTLDELKEALSSNAEYVLLDNMDNETIAEAVKMNAGKAKLEASGGITLERINSLSKLGVDFISVGALTHSVKSSDISLEIIPA